MLERRAARSGQPTAVLAGVWLHSRYDPEEEARRWALECRGPGQAPPPSTLLLLGAGLGHLTRALSAAMPDSRLLAVYYHSGLYAFAAASRPPSARCWHPGSQEGLVSFLRRHIGELEAEGLRVVEWAPSSRACPQLSLQANAAVAQLLKELRGSLVTTAALGRRWLRNSFYNFVALEVTGPPPRLPEGLPLLIAASGPTLEQCLPLIRRQRRRLLLWALPSAAAALQAADLRPDRVIMTDPGYYAMVHLHGALPAGTPLCMPLSAGTGAWRIQARVSYFSQDTVFERQLLAALELRVPTVLPNGTVSASALELALQCGAGPVVFAGLDFLFRDVHTHARPNAAERLLRLRQSRLRPVLHLLLSHTLQQSAPPRGPDAAPPGSEALATYAGWFARHGLPAGRPVFRLFPSSVAVPGMPPLDERGFEQLFAGPAAMVPAQPEAPQPVLPARERRKRAALGILRGWAEQLARSSRRLSAARGVSAETLLQGLLADAPLMEMLYHCDAPGVADLRRRLRLQGAPAAGQTAVRLLRTAADFFEALAARMEDGA